MAGKLKNAPRSRKPKAAKPSRMSRIEVVEDGELTSAGRADAINQILQMHTMAAKSICILKDPDKRIDTWKQLLLRPQFGGGPIELVGGSRLVPTEEGMRTTIDGRTGVIAWEELVAASIDEWGEENDDDPNYEANGRDLGLSTSSPAGIVAHDPDATPRTKVDRLRETADAIGRASRAIRNGSAAAKLPRVQAGDKFVDCPPEGVLCVVLTTVIERNPFQPRLDFNAAELEELAASIDAHGQLTPIDVRPRPGCHGAYQISDGERRWRAIKQLGRGQVTIRIVPRTDEEMAVIGMETAVRRVELNPIEKALQFQRFIEEFGWTQDRVAGKYDTSQGQVSNLLRLLKLPERVRLRIISREIPATHARMLVPYTEAHESFWQRLEKESGLGKGPICSLPEWEHAIKLARGWSNDIDREPYATQGCVHLPKVPLTDEQLASLGVVEIPHTHQRGKKTVTEVTRYATNQQAWKRIVAAHEKQFFEAHPEKKPKGSRKAKANASTPKAAQPAKERGVTEKLLIEWLRSWRQWLISEAVHGAKEDGALFRAATLIALVEGSFSEDELLEVLPTPPKKPASRPRRGIATLPETVEALSRLTSLQLAEAQRRLVLNGFGFDPHKGPHRSSIFRYNSIDLTVAVCTLLAIDLEQQWSRNLAGPLTAGYLELHSREQLADLLREFDQIAPPPSTAKKELISRLLACPAFKSRLPQELAALVSPTKSKKGGNKR